MLARLSEDDIQALEIDAKLSHAQICEVAKIKGLHRLKLGQSCEGFENLIAVCDHITDLDLTHADADQIQLLSHFRNLRSLSLRSANLGRKELGCIAKLPTPFKIHIEDSVIDNKALRSFAGSSMYYSVFGNCGVTDEGVRELAKQTWYDLSLHKNPITSASIKYLCRNTQMENLTLSETQIDDDIAEFLPNLKLRRFAVSKTEVGNLTASALAHVSSLWGINLSFTRIDNEALAHLATLPNLTTLLISGTDVDDSGARHLLTSPLFKWLIADDTNISAEMRNRLFQRNRQ